MARPIPFASLRRALTALCAATALAGCGGSHQDAPGAEGARPASPQGEGSGRAVDDQALRDHRLEMQQVRRYYTASGSLESLMVRDRAFARSLLAATDPPQRQALLQANAAARQAIHDAGLSPRDFVIVEAVLQHASLVHSFRKDGQDVPPTDNEANVRFVGENEAELRSLWQQRMERIQAAMDSAPG